MKSAKILIIIFFLLLAQIFFIPRVFATTLPDSGDQNPSSPGDQGGYQIPNPLTATSFEDLVKSVAQWLYYIMIPLSAIMFLYAGAMFMTSGGDEEKIKKAKRAILWAVIGVAVILINYGFIDLIKSFLQDDSSSPSPNGQFSCAGQSDVGKACPGGGTCQSSDFGYTCLSQ